jgi:hypothetical protein
MPWVLEEIDQEQGHGNPSPVHLRFVAPPPPRSPTTADRSVQLRLPVPSIAGSLAPPASAPIAKKQFRTTREQPAQQPDIANCQFLPVTPRHRRFLGISPRNRMSPRFHRQCGHGEPKRDCHKQTSPRHGLHSLAESGSAPSSHPASRTRPQLTPRVPGPDLSPQPGAPPPRHNMVAQLMRRLQDRDWASRKAAVESLGSLVTGDARVLDGVMQHLESRSERARQTAVWTLSRIVARGNRGAVDRLLERIAHPLLEVRMAAVAALGQVGAAPFPAKALFGAFLSLSPPSLPPSTPLSLSLYSLPPPNSPSFPLRSFSLNHYLRIHLNRICFDLLPPPFRLCLHLSPCLRPCLSLSLHFSRSLARPPSYTPSARLPRPPAGPSRLPAPPRRQQREWVVRAARRWRTGGTRRRWRGWCGGWGTRTGWCGRRPWTRCSRCLAGGTPWRSRASSSASTTPTGASGRSTRPPPPTPPFLAGLKGWARRCRGRGLRGEEGVQRAVRSEMRGRTGRETSSVEGVV